MKRTTATVLQILVVLGVIAAARLAAYETYHNPNLDDQGYCATCHPGFSGGPVDALHALHTGGTDPLTANCDVCHTSSGFDNPIVMWSAGDGLGCTGCHGRDYGEAIEANYVGLPVVGKPKASGYGLRKHHLRSGITACLDCHEDVPQSQILREVVDPPYYARADVGLGGAPLDACDNEDTENDADTAGLDNDGDSLYDADDPDCKGVLPDIDPDPRSVDFGTVTIGETATWMSEVQNQGADDLTVLEISRCDGTSAEYTWSPEPPFVVAAGASETLTVTYAPTDEGTDPGCLSITSDDPDERILTLDVTGEGALPLAPDIVLDPDSLDFGVLFPGGSSTVSTEVRNAGTVDLSVLGVELCAGTSAEYSWALDVAIISAGSSETLTVTYAPADLGTDDGCLVITSDDPDDPTVTLDLTGTGSNVAQPDIALEPSALDFGTVVVGQSATVTTEVQNTGTADLSITAVDLCAGTSAEYTWTPGAPLTVPSGGSETLSVTYTPLDAGSDVGCLTIASDDADEPVLTLDVTAAGEDAPTAVMGLDPTSLEFGTLLVGSTASLRVDIRNTGTARLVVDSLRRCDGTSGEFTWWGGSGFVVPAGATEDILVVYEPDDLGTDAGCLTWTTNDPNHPTVELPLTGTGTDVAAPDLDAEFPVLDHGVVAVGETSILTVELRNVGTRFLTVSGVARCDGTSSEYGWNPRPSVFEPLSIRPRSQRTLTVTYTPEDVGVDNGCLVITSDDPDTPSVELSLAGVGGEIGAGEPNIALAPTSLDFGGLLSGDSLDRNVEVRNTGTEDLVVAAIALCAGTSAEYTWAPLAPLTISAGESETVTVTYAPANVGADEGCLVLTSDDPDEPTVTLEVAGVGTSPAVSEPDIELDLTELEFGALEPGASQSLTAQIRNAGQGELLVSTIALCAGTSAEYTWTPTAPLTLAAGASESLTVTYAPDDRGRDEGCLAIGSDDPDQGTIVLFVRGRTVGEALQDGCFRRGDSNIDGEYDISDPVHTLTALFLGMGIITCEDASDSNDDGLLDLSDPIFSLEYLFLGGPMPADPGLECGLDPTGDRLDCDEYNGSCECPVENTATLAGTVTNSLTGVGIAGLTIGLEPVIAGVTVITGEDGSFSVDVPIGVYTLTLEKTHFEPRAEIVTVIPDGDFQVDIALVPVAPVIVTALVVGDASPGGSVAATATVEILDGSTIESFGWAQEQSVQVTIEDADTDAATVVLPDEGAFKDELIAVLSEPPIGEDELPPNVHLPEGEFPAALQSRFQVVGLNPFSLEEAALVTLEVAVTTTSGIYTDEAEIHTELPWKPAAGIRNVPVGVPVLLQSKSHVDEDGDGVNDVTGAPTTYDWILETPAASNAVLLDATTQNPDFTPDVAGSYTLTVTDTTQPPGDEVVTLEIYAGTWRGVITGQDENGRPLADDCTGCHNDTIAPDKFTPWARSGHAEIFTNNLNGSTHYGDRCFACHTVGFDPGAENGGVDEAADYGDFLAAGLLNNPGDNWTTVVTDFPETARKSNVQCENCHGPQSGGAHTKGDVRIDLSSDVCATCHGEPLRHARFQQWQLSAHANYELAIDEGSSGSCSRCHTANGFLAWLPVLLDDDPATDPTASVQVTWTEDQTHPQTCATCHDPHDPGSTSGSNTNATVRITDNTPLLIGGFRALGVGRGAICMTCHNSRRGLRNDGTFANFVGTSEAARAPHGSAQTDVLMGQNAYLVETGVRGGHSFVEDTCVNCHMEQTPPPGALSYQSGGTNHTFTASVDICSRCHGEVFNAVGVQTATDIAMHELEGELEAALLSLIDGLTTAGNSIDLNGADTITDASEVSELVFGETRGRQAIAVIFTDEATVGPFRMTDIDVLGPDGAVKGQLYDFADERVIKAGWNWTLVHNDGSRGVHNPSFVFDVLGAASEALDELAEDPPPPFEDVTVSAEVSGDAVPGGELAVTAIVETPDGSTIESIVWTQSHGTEVTIENVGTDSATVLLPAELAFKETLLAILKEPPIGEDELPPNVHLPEGEFPAGLQSRFQIVGLNPFVLEETALVTLEATVTTTSGVYTEEVEIHTVLPWRPAAGIRNVPLGRPVLLQGKDHVDDDGDEFNDVTGAPITYNWSLETPAGSAAVLLDENTQNPEFTPDVAGSYMLTVTDTTQLPGDEVVTLEIYGGTWRGVITGQDENGRPLAADCTGCHNDTIAPDKFTPWARSGHAEIFTNNLDTSTHYGDNCFACHTVGFDPGADNGGVDEAADYGDFIAAGLLNNPGDNWTTVVEEFPETARKANIQCENCHGPQSGGAHTKGDVRIDLSADVCATCHGEPLRHARFQQWQLSAHANYELAIDEGSSGNCSRCHTANGFLAWLPTLTDDDPATDPTASIQVTWTADESHPQTCATCHDPHDIGTTSGSGTNATVRIADNTPLLIGGFRALGVGRGAICMTCHNSRRGLRNDETFANYVGTSEAARAPHGSAQSDVLMGQNAYLVEVGNRGGHSFVEDTCVNCHMEQTPPPGALSYNSGGTNHTFSASVDICSRCHGEVFNAVGVQTAAEIVLEELQGDVEEALLTLIDELTAAGNTIDLNGAATITAASEISSIEFGETRGRQAIAVTLTDATTVGLTRLTDVDVLDADSAVTGQLYDFADDRLIKAGWNWNLVHNDGSRGVHNPDFVFDVLEAASNALAELAAE